MGIAGKVELCLIQEDLFVELLKYDIVFEDPARCTVPYSVVNQISLFMQVTPPGFIPILPCVNTSVLFMNSCLHRATPKPWYILYSSCYSSCTIIMTQHNFWRLSVTIALST